MSLAQVEMRFLISFSHDHKYLTLVLQMSVSSDFEAPIKRTKIPDCSCERLLVLGAGRLVSIPGP